MFSKQLMFVIHERKTHFVKKGKFQFIVGIKKIHSPIYYNYNFEFFIFTFKILEILNKINNFYKLIKFIFLGINLKILY